MYFAIVGNKSFALHELLLVNPTHMEWYTDNIVVFETLFPHLLLQCGQVIKRGRVMSKDFSDKDFFSVFNKEKKIIGTNKKHLGVIFKKMFSDYGIKRFKCVDLFHTDKEVKSNGIEIIEIKPSKQGSIDEKNDALSISVRSFFSSGLYGVVLGYQNIALYEIIDFQKPVRGMEVGMMPAKLTTFLVNLARIAWKKQMKKVCKEDFSFLKHTFTVWDPFVGFGTTSFVVYAMGYNAIGSDKNITSAKKNLHRWNTKKQSCFFENVLHLENNGAEQKIFFFKHDVTKPFRQKVLYNVDVIVTEGWLGPRVRHFHVHSRILQKNQETIWSVYKSFLENVYNFFFPLAENLTKIFPPLVLTIPWYVQIKQSIASFVVERCTRHGLICYILPEIYKRSGQVVGRQILVITYTSIDNGLIF